MLFHRLRRYPNIVPALAERLVFAGNEWHGDHGNNNLLTLVLLGPTVYIQHMVNVPCLLDSASIAY